MSELNRIPATTRATLKAAAADDHLLYMIDRADQVEITKDSDDRWNVKVYDKHDNHIGGICSVTSLVAARVYAHQYAVLVTQPIG